MGAATKNADFGGFVGEEGVIFFSTKIYRDHINILLSELGYSELVQRLFEKMTFFHVDPLPQNPKFTCTCSAGGNGQQQVINLWRTHKKVLIPT